MQPEPVIPSSPVETSEPKSKRLLKAILILAVIVVAILVGFLTAKTIFAGAFDTKGSIQVKVMNSATKAPIAGANVQIKVVGAAIGCPTSAGVTGLSGTITFHNCPAYSKGIKKYKLVNVTASGYTTKGSNSYRAHRNAFNLDVRGKKGSKRISKINVYIAKNAPPRTPFTPQPPPVSTGPALRPSPNDNSVVPCPAAPPAYVAQMTGTNRADAAAITVNFEGN